MWYYSKFKCRNKIFKQSLNIKYPTIGYSMSNIILLDIGYSNVKITRSDIHFFEQEKMLMIFTKSLQL